ncbi:hypothetical protein GCM10017771_32820 [Streptomyces capitiformicae]|uniref:Uncharacterized protein n=2 Tax=Streptomyces capitiformicae TaxID=2014920 RepID=A0A919GR13_9ACTN|nr:hypothetical protein GCM10017771_32820 [Streptomyces capitiformicae]
MGGGARREKESRADGAAARTYEGDAMRTAGTRVHQRTSAVSWTRVNRSGRVPSRAVAGLLAFATGLVLLAGCGLPDHRQSATGQGGASASAEPSFVPKAPVSSGKPLGPDAHVPDPGAVDDSDPTAVSKAWAEMTYSYDTKYDASPHDAGLRAVRWCSKRKADAERSYRPASGPGADWNTWAQHRAWTTVTVSIEQEDDSPKDGKQVAYRSLVVEGEAHGRDGWTGRGPRLTAHTKLVRSSVGEPWRVDDVIVVEAVAPPSPGEPSASAADPSAQ